LNACTFCVGAVSNAHAGRDFEEAAQLFWAETGVRLQTRAGGLSQIKQ
jgi:hypothetical protein